MTRRKPPAKHVNTARPVMPGETYAHTGARDNRYVHGTARVRLALCPDCGCYMPPGHTCQAGEDQ